MSFIKIHKAENEMDAALTKGYLESNGINVFTNSSNSNLTAMTGYIPTTALPYGVYVEESSVEEAKRLLAERD